MYTKKVISKKNEKELAKIVKTEKLDCQSEDKSELIKTILRNNFVKVTEGHLVYKVESSEQVELTGENGDINYLDYNFFTSLKGQAS